MFRNFFINKSLVTLVAGLVCVAIVVYFYHYRVNKIIDTINGPVAIERLDARHEIKKEDIKMIKVARSLLSSNVITNRQNIEGKFVNYNTYIPKNVSANLMTRLGFKVADSRESDLLTDGRYDATTLRGNGHGVLIDSQIEDFQGTFLDEDNGEITELLKKHNLLKK